MFFSRVRLIERARADSTCKSSASLKDFPLSWTLRRIDFSLRYPENNPHTFQSPLVSGVLDRLFGFLKRDIEREHFFLVSYGREAVGAAHIV